MIFENVRGVAPSELMQFMNLFTTSFDEVVNYEDFIKILYKFGDMPAPMGSQDFSPQRSSFEPVGQPAIDHNEIQNRIRDGMREGIMSRLGPKDQEIVNRMRSACRG